MVDIDMTLTLPDDLAREAAARGLLTADAVQQLLATEVARQRKRDQLVTSMNQLAAVECPPLSTDEVNAEIAAARAERRSHRAGRA